MSNRFEYVMFDGFIDNKNYEKEYISPHEVANILNEQHEQIQAQAIVIQGYQERCDKVFKENEQLKSDKNDLITALFKRSDEKQKLQSEIQDFQELLTQKDNVCYEQVIKLIDEKIEIADTYRTPIKSLKYGDDLGYWNGVYQSMKELKKELKGDVE